jgi:hypothetical protein
MLAVSGRSGNRAAVSIPGVRAMPDHRPKLRPDGVPSRCDRSLMTAAELAITAAMIAVEGAGASLALTEAVTLLSKARDRVADHVEGVS